MKEQYLLLILLSHFLCDFVLQTSEQAERKHKLEWDLFAHVFMYSLVMSVFMLTILTPLNVFRFFIVTGVTHYIIDAFTSNISKSFFDRKDYHNGFVTVGADQVLHYIQLYLTVKYLL